MAMVSMEQTKIITSSQRICQSKSNCILEIGEPKFLGKLQLKLTQAPPFAQEEEITPLNIQAIEPLMMIAP